MKCTVLPRTQEQIMFVSINSARGLSMWAVRILKNLFSFFFLHLRFLNEASSSIGNNA